MMSRTGSGFRLSALGACAALMLAAGAILHAQQLPVRVETALSQTAVWRGDVFDYHITLVFDRGIEIVRDNLRPDALNVEPFSLVGLETGSRPGTGNADILDLHLKLALLEASGNEAIIPPITIYYATRRPGPLGKGSEVETHTLVIPEQTIGIATTLTDDSRDIHDAMAVPDPPAAGRIIWFAGWGALVASLALTAFWTMSHYRQGRRADTRRDGLAIERQVLERLDQLEERA